MRLTKMSKKKYEDDNKHKDKKNKTSCTKIKKFKIL